MLDDIHPKHLVTVKLGGSSEFRDRHHTQKNAETEAVTMSVRRGADVSVTSRIGIRPIPVWEMSDTGIEWRVAAQNRNSKT